MAVATRIDARSEAFSTGFSDGLRSFFRTTGGWGNVNGPGIFMVRMILSGTSLAVTMGLTGAALTAAFYGTASIPFMVAACCGFVFGAVGFYRDAVRQSLTYLERYPGLLQLHLDANFPTRGFLLYRRDQLRAATFSRSWTLQSMLVCSWLTAQPAIDIFERDEEAFVNEARAELRTARGDVNGAKEEATGIDRALIDPERWSGKT